jgi:glycosyltransferase involved in cell wall biosynthesis
MLDGRFASAGQSAPGWDCLRPSFVRPRGSRIDTQRPQSGVSAVVPAYQEEGAIGNVVREIRGVLERAGVPFEVLVVDDGSTDATAERAREAGAEVVRHDANRGYGAALKTGIRRARHETVAILDADGTYPLEALPALLAHAGEADMVVGARTGGRVAMPQARRFPKWVLRRLANYLAGRRIPDLNSGLRVFRRSAVLDFFHILPSGFSFTTTITLALLSDDYEVRYVPIDYNPRVGRSKISPVRDTTGFLFLIVRTIMYFNPLKVFGPVSLVIFLAGFVLLAYRLIFEHDVGQLEILLLVVSLQIGMTGVLADVLIRRLAGPRFTAGEQESRSRESTAPLEHRQPGATTQREGPSPPHGPS